MPALDVSLAIGFGVLILFVILLTIIHTLWRSPSNRIKLRQLNIRGYFSDCFSRFGPRKIRGYFDDCLGRFRLRNVMEKNESDSEEGVGLIGSRSRPFSESSHGEEQTVRDSIFSMFTVRETHTTTTHANFYRSLTYPAFSSRHSPLDVPEDVSPVSEVSTEPIPSIRPPPSISLPPIPAPVQAPVPAMGGSSRSITPRPLPTPPPPPPPPPPPIATSEPIPNPFVNASPTTPFPTTPAATFSAMSFYPGVVAAPIEDATKGEVGALRYLNPADAEVQPLRIGKKGQVGWV